MPLACFSNVSSREKHAKGMSLRYGVIVFGDLTQAQHQIGDTKLLIFFHTTQQKSTSLRVVEISKIRSYRLYFFFISQIGGVRA